MSPPELHRPLALERIGAAGREEVVEASPAECAELARRMAIPAVLSLTCRFRLHKEPGDVVLAEGALHARLVRDCVVSLEPFETEAREDFRIRFVPEGDLEADAPLDPESEDEVGYAGGSIDLGEAAAEQLALALDPYPRAPGAELPDSAADSDVSPFAALARLKRME